MATKVKPEATNGTHVNRIADVIDTPATMKPQIVTFKVTGTSPLLQNNPEKFIGQTDSSALATKKKYIDEEEARLRVYQSEDGSFGHPSESFKKSILRAVTGKKFGKLSAPGCIRGAVFTVEQYSVIEDANGKPLKAYTIDRRSVVNPANKARILRCRPIWNTWTMRLSLEIDTAIITPEHVLESLNLAGRIIGVGDFRPEKGGGFGRFRAELVK